MNILVTGGAGFIGSNLSESLLNKGHKVSIIDNFNDFYPIQIKKDNAEILKNNPACTIYEKDITDISGMDEVFSKEKPDIVYHLAARAGVRPSISAPYLYENVNVTGTLNILELCKKYGIKKMIFGSSSSVYGKRESVPFKEDDLLDSIISPYAATKAAGEHFCRCYHLIHGMNIIVLRFFTVYGPRQRPEMAICKFARLIDSGEKITLFGDGTSSRDYTYIGDILNGLMNCLGANIPFGVFNLGESTTVYLKDLVGIIEKYLGKKANVEYGEYQKGDVPKTFADITQAKKHLGYAPSVGIDEGIKRFIVWYREHYEKGIYRPEKTMVK